MTNRLPILCTVCEHKYILRIAMGHLSMQEHFFECVECESKIHIHFDTSIGFKCIENSKLDLNSNSDATIFNLHPELLIPKEELHSEFYSASIHEGLRLVKENLNFMTPKNYELTQLFVKDLNRITQNWNYLKIAWKLKNSNKTNKLIFKQLKKYLSTQLNSKESSFEEILFDFNNVLLFPSYIETIPKIHNTILEHIKKNNQKDELDKCIKYYILNDRKKNMEKILDIYNIYFNLYNEFNNIAIYITTSKQLPLDYIVSSQNFDQTKMFYGQLYEVYNTSISFISMIHNVYQDRKFNEFKNITLNNYLASDKAGRTKNFENTENFDWFSEFINSKLRNASHHGNIELNNNTLIYYAGKPLKRYTMSYTRYLEICMQLFIRLISLLQFQILSERLYELENSKKYNKTE